MNLPKMQIFFARKRGKEITFGRLIVDVWRSAVYQREKRRMQCSRMTQNNALFMHYTCAPQRFQCYLKLNGTERSRNKYLGSHLGIELGTSFTAGRAVTDCANTNRASAVSIATFIRGQKSTQASSGVKQNAIYALLACCKCVVLPLLQSLKTIAALLNYTCRRSFIKLTPVLSSACSVALCNNTCCTLL